jgi:deoxyribodipyrimidine photo-lyase
VDPNYQLQPVTEKDAWQTLASFLKGRAKGYSRKISSPSTAFQHGSRLSVHLAWGTISTRMVYQQTLKAIKDLSEKKENGDAEAGRIAGSLRPFMSRLHWRDHFIQRLETEPDMELRALNPAYRDLEYENNDEYLQRFLQGTTGFPMVDACVRCLRHGGFMNFRMRAMLTSFACHVLHIDWRRINAPMAQWFADYEPGIHLSQLQMQAGVVGINTLRAYSPTKQLLDQDPEVIFVKKWIPELRDFDKKEILEHEDKALGSYPAQMVDAKERSKIMRSRVYSIRKQEGYWDIASKVFEKHGSRKRSLSKRKPQS